MDKKAGYLMDTNILIYYFADAIPDNEILKIEEIFRTPFNITKIEFLGWSEHTDYGSQLFQGRSYENSKHLIISYDYFVQIFI